MTLGGLMGTRRYVNGDAAIWSAVAAAGYSESGLRRVAALLNPETEVHRMLTGYDAGRDASKLRKLLYLAFDALREQGRDPEEDSLMLAIRQALGLYTNGDEFNLFPWVSCCDVRDALAEQWRDDFAREAAHV